MNCHLFTLHFFSKTDVIQCSSNLAFQDNLKDLRVISVNLTKCYQVSSMHSLDGCGAAKGKLGVLSVDFQNAGYRQFSHGWEK